MRSADRRFKRACDLIKADRIGVSTGIEKAVSREVSAILSDFFSLSTEPQTTIVATEKGFDIVISVKAKSVKSFRLVDGF